MYIYIYIHTWQTIPISASTGRWIRRLLVSPIASTQKATRRAEAGPYNGGSKPLASMSCKTWGLKETIPTSFITLLPGFQIQPMVPNPQQNRWNGWSTVACWMTPHDKFLLLLRAMSLQNDAWHVPSKVSSFCSSKLQQNKNPVKHRRFEKHVRGKKY